jgi:hypothetical protein
LGFNVSENYFALVEELGVIVDTVYGVVLDI